MIHLKRLLAGGLGLGMFFGGVYLITLIPNIGDIFWFVFVFGIIGTLAFSMIYHFGLLFFPDEEQSKGKGYSFYKKKGD